MPLTIEFAKDVLITACEGGINYWAPVSNYHPSIGIAAIRDAETGLTYTLDANDIQKTIKKIVAGGYGKAECPSYLREALRKAIKYGDAGDLDADDCDAIIQLGIFSEIKYG